MSALALPLPYITTAAASFSLPLPIMPSTLLAPLLPLPPAHTIQPHLKAIHSKSYRRPSTNLAPPQPPLPLHTLEQREEVEIEKVTGRIEQVRRWREGLQRGEVGSEVPLTGEMVRRREEQKRLQQRRRTEQAQAAKQQLQRDKEERKEQETAQPTDGRPTRRPRHPHVPPPPRHRSIVAASDDRVRVALDEDDGSRLTQQGRDDVLALLESLQRSSPRPPSPLFAPPLHPSPHSVFTPSPIHPRAVTPTRHSSQRHYTADVSDEQMQKAAQDRRQYLAFLNEQVDAMRAEGVTAATPRQRGRPTSSRGRGRGRGGREMAAHRQHPYSADRPHTANHRQLVGDEQLWQQHDQDGLLNSGRGRIDWSDLERQAQQLQDEWIDLQADTAMRTTPLTLSPTHHMAVQPLPPLPAVEVREETDEERLRRQLLARLQQVKVEVEVERNNTDTSHTTATTTRSHTQTTSRKANTTASQKSKPSAVRQQRSGHREGGMTAAQVPAAPSYPFLQHLQQLFSVQPTFVPPTPPAPVSTAQYLPMAAPVVPPAPIAVPAMHAVFAPPPPPATSPVVIVTPPHTVVTPNLPPPAMSFTPPPPTPSQPPPAPTRASIRPSLPTVSVEQATVALQAEETNTRRDAATDTMPSLFASASERAAAPPSSPNMPTSLSSTRGAQTEVQPPRPAPVQRDPATLSSSAAMQPPTAAPTPVVAAPTSTNSLLEAQLRARNVQNEALLSSLEAFLARKKQHEAQAELRSRLAAQQDTADDGGLLSLLLRAFELADEKKVDEQWAAAVRREEEEAKRREAEETRRRQAAEAEQRRRVQEEEEEKRRLETERRRLEDEERRQRERADEQQRLLVEMERRMEEKLNREKQEQQDRLKHEQAVQQAQQQALLDQQLLQKQHEEALHRQLEEEERRVVEQREMAEQERQQRLVDEARRKETDRLEYERRQAEARQQEEERIQRWQAEEEARAQRRREEQEEIERVRVRLLDEREEWERQKREEAREKEFRMLGALKAEVESLKQQKVQMDAANDMAKRRVDAAEKRAMRNSKARAGADSESGSSEEEVEDEEEEEADEEQQRSDSSHTDDTASTVRSEGEFGAIRVAQPRVSTGYRSPGTFSPAISLPPSPGHVTAASLADSQHSSSFTVGRSAYAGVVQQPPSPGSVLVNERGLSGEEQRRRVALQLSTIKRRGQRPAAAGRRRDGSEVSDGALTDGVSEDLSEGEISRTGQHVLVGGSFIPLTSQSSARPPRAIARPPKQRRQPSDRVVVEPKQASTAVATVHPPVLAAQSVSALPPTFPLPVVHADVLSTVVAAPPLRIVANKLTSHSASASGSGWEEEIERAHKRLPVTSSQQPRVSEAEQAIQPTTALQPPTQPAPPTQPTVQSPVAAVTSAALAIEPHTRPVAASGSAEQSATVSRRPSVQAMVSQWESKRSSTAASTAGTPIASSAHSRTASSHAHTDNQSAPAIASKPHTPAAHPASAAEASDYSADEKQFDTAANSESEQPAAVAQRVEQQQQREKAGPVRQPPRIADKDSDESIDIEEEYSADDQWLNNI